MVPQISMNGEQLPVAVQFVIEESITHDISKTSVLTSVCYPLF